jgi:hypothetical protein
MTKVVIALVGNTRKLLRSITHTFDSPETARAFFAMPELKEAMRKAGVDADAVEISYFDEVEIGALVGV